MKSTTRHDIGLLILRCAAGLLLCLGHGLQKWPAVLAGGSSTFPDPLGIGPQASALMSMSAECGASMLVAVGLFTRWATLPVIGTMVVICTLAHTGEPWLSKEPSVLYMLAFGVILLMGPGRLSLDALRGRRFA